jgi:hypothetical protein
MNTGSMLKYIVTNLGCVTVDGFGLVSGFIDHLYIQIRTTSNYSAIPNLHTLQTTTTTAKSFPALCVFTSRSLETASISGDSSASRAQVLPSEPPVQNSTLNYQQNYSAISSQPPLQCSTELVAPILFFL